MAKEILRVENLVTEFWVKITLQRQWTEYPST